MTTSSTRTVVLGVRRLSTVKGLIILDTRDPKALRTTIRKFLETAGLTIEEAALPSADILMVTPLTTVGIERKTGEDLISSALGKGRKGIPVSRLSDQLTRLKAAYPVPILLVTGILGETPDGWVKTSYGDKPRMRWATWSGMAKSIQHEGVIIDYCPCPARLGTQLLEMFRYYSKKQHKFMEVK
jgi:ERCC4-type nuclease